MQKRKFKDKKPDPLVRAFFSINPYTEKKFLQVSSLSSLQLKKVLISSGKAFEGWKRLTVRDRKVFIRNLIKILDEKKLELAKRITQEMGKPYSQSAAEIEKCQVLAQYVCRYAESFLKRKILPSSPQKSYVSFQPLGAILGIMPWNFPAWQTFRFALPVLAGGNVVLIKPAPNVMGGALLLKKIFDKAGFPKGVFQNLPISLPQTKELIGHPFIQGVSLTGSVKAGKAVAETAGRHLKKCVLELGGSDPYLILDKAHLELSAKECVLSRMNNNGQSCIAAKRFIVTKKNLKTFSNLVVQKMKTFKMGDPLLSQTTLGPLARKDLQQHLQRQVQALIKRGAKCLLGGLIPKRKGYFYPATVLIIKADKLPAVFTEELFGPAALIIVVKNEAEALKAANASIFGLGSAVFGRDKALAESIVRDKISAGLGSVNRGLHSHPALPFGGIKQSGFGRELSEFGFYEFINIKTIQA